MFGHKKTQATAPYVALADTRCLALQLRNTAYALYNRCYQDKEADPDFLLILQLANALGNLIGFTDEQHLSEGVIGNTWSSMDFLNNLQTVVAFNLPLFEVERSKFLSSYGISDATLLLGQVIHLVIQRLAVGSCSQGPLLAPTA